MTNSWLYTFTKWCLCPADNSQTNRQKKTTSRLTVQFDKQLAVHFDKQLTVHFEKRRRLTDWLYTLSKCTVTNSWLYTLSTHKQINKRRRLADLTNSWLYTLTKWCLYPADNSQTNKQKKTTSRLTVQFDKKWSIKNRLFVAN